jgi:phosphoribosylformylglycinamidine synthase
VATKFGVIVFPGSNCDHDAYHAAAHVMNAETRFIWHKDTDLQGSDIIIIPGGFSYGDYLRSGAIARFSPVLNAIVDFANKGGIVMGICNGFQILLESGLLEGAMLRNRDLRFVCKHIWLRTENNDTLFTNQLEKGQVVKVPIAHGEGNYFTDPDTLKRLEDNEQIIFRYCEPDGSITDKSNPNGSMNNIAGICNKGKNVLGMMPHPERVVEPFSGSTDGRFIFDSLLSTLHTT